MSIAHSLLPEFDNETATTRKLLALIPEKEAAWKPHPKSFTLGDLGVHLAGLITWTKTTLRDSEFDMNPANAEGFKPGAFTSTAAVLEMFDANVAAARTLIAETPDPAFMETWTLKKAGQTMFAAPRIGVLRSFVLNHLVHHRGQLTVYLRLRDVPLPSVYGPTADEAM